MTKFTYIRRSLWFHARSHLGAFLGAAAGGAVLIGALVVGESVRASLRKQAELRLGQVELALQTGDRLFRSALASQLQASLRQTGLVAGVRLPVAAALELPAVAVAADGSARANQVKVIGVDRQFWSLAPRPTNTFDIPSGQVIVNRPLAARLKVHARDTVVLRIRKPVALSSDAPMAPEEDSSFALRLKVLKIADDEAFGSFGLVANQTPPLNAFVSLGELQRRAGAMKQANLLLVGRVSALPPTSQPRLLRRMMRPLDLPKVAADHLRRSWQLADAQLEWRQVESNRVLELRSQRVFIDPIVGRTVLDGSPETDRFTALVARQVPISRPAGILTYFVNELRAGDRATPYSMVAALDSAPVDENMGDDEIILTDWTADDLNARPGDEVTLKYFVVGARRQLDEKTATFRVRRIIPIQTPGVDPDLMPDFPGMSDAENCRDWDTGLPIDLANIRDKDEAYWDEYQGTPKAFVTLGAGRRLWENRFGDLTAIRFRLDPANAGTPRGLNTAGIYRSRLDTALRRSLDPAAFGLAFRPVKEQAQRASSQSQDFGQLFLGFSFFLIVAALLLMSILLQFGIDQRAGQTGTLLALGFRRRTVRRLLFTEAAAVTTLGCAVGAWAGTWYARAMLEGLATVWNEAIGGAVIGYHASASTLAAGFGLAALVTFGTLWLALRGQAGRPARVLLAQGTQPEEAIGHQPDGATMMKRARRGLWLGLALAAGAVSLVLYVFLRGQTAAAGLFFAAGALLLVAGVILSSAGLWRLAASEAAEHMTLGGLGVRNATRRRRRTLAVIGLLASGSFLIASIGVFRLDANHDWQQRSSGTGGFALIANSTQPVIHDLDSASGREAYGLDTNALSGVLGVPLRVRDGDDASCLNLNRAQQPRLLGVNPELLAEREAFTFAKTVGEAPPDSQPWRLLQRSPSLPSDEVPAIGDLAAIVWALGKKVGDVIPYTDERGHAFNVRIVGAVANSILQGSLLIAEDEFVERFPTITGYRMFLIDAPSDALESVSAELTRGLSDVGLEVVPTAQRLAEFNAIQNTYLGTFQILGGLGLILGSFGLGVVVLRNIFERRAELALLLALGLRRPALKKLVLAEHVAMLLAGLAVGVLAAAVAVFPSATAPGSQVPYATLTLTLVAVLVNGAFWTWLATVLALRGRLLDALRNE